MLLLLFMELTVEANKVTTARQDADITLSLWAGRPMKGVEGWLQGKETKTILLHKILVTY